MSELPIQPIACVVGHPIAGNPMQFAMERALAAADLDWRFLSLDVAPERFQDAFRGIDALGFRGASIASPHRTAAAAMLDRLDVIARRAGWVDCVARDSEGHLKGYNLLGSALAASVDLDALVHERAEPPTAVLLGEADHGSAACHGLLDGPIARWIVVDVDPEVLQPQGTARLPVVDEGVKYPSPSSADDVEMALSTAGSDTNPRPANDARSSVAPEVSPDDADTPPPSPPPTDSPASPKQQTSDLESPSAGSPSTEPATAAAGDEAATSLYHERIITRAASLDEAITEETVLIIRGVMANGEPVRFPEELLDRLEPPAMVVDMAIAASTSALARAAVKRGLQGITRLDLLIIRTAMAMELWTGQTPDHEILREAFEEYLEI